MAVHRSVLKEDNFLCELCADTHSDVSNNGENEILDSDSDVTMTSLRKRLHRAVGFTSDSETSTEETGSKPESSDDTSDMSSVIGYPYTVTH
jgi:hypothetical protein